MTSPAATTACYPCAWYGRARVLENVPIAEATYRIRLHCPEIAERIVPGQFLMLRLPGSDDPLLGRPLALYDTVLDDAGNAIAVDIVYLVVGKMTARLAQWQPGQPIELWGPLGNGFMVPTQRRLLMVAGGIGQTPFLALARAFLGTRRYGLERGPTSTGKSVTLCYGARRASLLAGVRDFREAGVEVRISTDDGSAGRHGLVTQLVAEAIAEDATATQIVACGPEKMLHAVSALAIQSGVPCQVSLETPMACGLGICFSCVAKVRDASGNWDYRRTCVEGPVFDAASIVFD